MGQVPRTLMALTKAEIRRRYRERHPERARQQFREWRERNLEQQRERERENTARMREKHPEKTAARALVRSAVKKGEMDRLPCEVCGEAKVQAHHDDYDKPLEVRWLCRKHHFELHTKQEDMDVREDTTGEGGDIRLQSSSGRELLQV